MNQTNQKNTKSTVESQEKLNGACNLCQAHKIERTHKKETHQPLVWRAECEGGRSSWEDSEIIVRVLLPVDWYFDIYFCMVPGTYSSTSLRSVQHTTNGVRWIRSFVEYFKIGHRRTVVEAGTRFFSLSRVRDPCVVVVALTARRRKETASGARGGRARKKKKRKKNDVIMHRAGTKEIGS